MGSNNDDAEQCTLEQSKHLVRLRPVYATGKPVSRATRRRLVWGPRMSYEALLVLCSRVAGRRVSCEGQLTEVEAKRALAVLKAEGRM